MTTGGPPRRPRIGRPMRRPLRSSSLLARVALQAKCPVETGGILKEIHERRHFVSTKLMRHSVKADALATDFPQFHSRMRVPFVGTFLASMICTCL
jgi:hypothetical protein